MNEKQISPIINNLANQINELKKEMNSTKELIQNIEDDDASLKSRIEKTNLLSYISIGLSASAIMLLISRRKFRQTSQ